MKKEENTEEKIKNETEETQVPEVSGDSINAENQIQNEANDSSVAAYAINE